MVFICGLIDGAYVGSRPAQYTRIQSVSPQFDAWKEKNIYNSTIVNVRWFPCATYFETALCPNWQMHLRNYSRERKQNFFTNFVGWSIKTQIVPSTRDWKKKKKNEDRKKIAIYRVQSEGPYLVGSSYLTSEMIFWRWTLYLLSSRFLSACRFIYQKKLYQFFELFHRSPLGEKSTSRAWSWKFHNFSFQPVFECCCCRFYSCFRFRSMP